MKITKAKLRQIIKEEIHNLKQIIKEEVDYPTQNIKLELHRQWFERNPGRPFPLNYNGFPSFNGGGHRPIPHIVDTLVRRGELTDVNPETGESTGHSMGAYPNPDGFGKGYWLTDFAKKQDELYDYIRENPGTSLKGALPGVDGEELTGIVQRLIERGKIWDRDPNNFNISTRGAKFWSPGYAHYG